MKSFIFFILGAAAGAVGGFFVTKYICEGKTEAKIAEVTAEARNFYKEKYEKEAEKVDEKADQKAHQILTKTYVSNSDDRIFGSKYDSNATSVVTDYRNPTAMATKSYLYMIDPDEAGMDDDYTQYSLDYYQDGSIVDENGYVLENPEEIVGDFTDELCLEKPEIFVRNDVTKTEYDICYIAASYEQPGGAYD